MDDVSSNHHGDTDINKDAAIDNENDISCVIDSLIATALKFEPLPAPLDTLPPGDYAASWSGQLLTCLRQVRTLLASGRHRASPATVARLHLLVNGCLGGCDCADEPWRSDEVTDEAESLGASLPPLLTKWLDFHPAVGVSDEPSCVPLSTVSMARLLVSLPADEEGGDSAALTEAQRRHAVTLTARLCGHHSPRWQLLGLDCLAAQFTPAEAALGRDLVGRLCHSRDPPVLERSLELCSSLRAIFPLEWVDKTYLECLESLSYECRIPLKLARLRPLAGFVRRLGLASIKYSSLMTRCIDNCLARCDHRLEPDTAECVWQVLDAYLRFCLFERRQLAKMLIEFVLRNPDCGCRHLPGIEPEFVDAVCRRIITQAPQAGDILGRFLIK